MSKQEGMNYAPQGTPRPVVKDGDFVFAAMRRDHGHINGMCNGLKEAGANLKWVYDSDTIKVKEFVQRDPEGKVAESEELILEESQVQLVSAAAISSHRVPLGLKVMDYG